MLNSRVSDQARHFVCPNLRSYYLELLSAVDTSKKGLMQKSMAYFTVNVVIYGMIGSGQTNHETLKLKTDVVLISSDCFKQF